MAGRTRVTRESIVEQARRIVAERGIAALTFQALAGALGVSKQAIIYWYPNKWELIRDFSLPELKAEADVLIAAVAPAKSGAEATDRFVRALVAHHLADLGRFRMLYLAPQFDERAAVPGAGELLAPIHAATSSMYSALAAKLAADPDFGTAEAARRMAVAAHMAGIGFITMVALADAMDDPMAHRIEAMLDALVALLTRTPAAAQ
jgi:AcrR family transcriptional regulator